MTTVYIEGPRAGGYIADEVSVNLSRRIVTIASGAGVLLPGTVLGKVTASGNYLAFDPAAEDGNEVAAAVLFDHVDATDTAVEAVVSATLTAVNAAEIIWPEGISDPDKATAIAALEDRQITVLPADTIIP